MKNKTLKSIAVTTALMLSMGWVEAAEGDKDLQGKSKPIAVLSVVAHYSIPICPIIVPSYIPPHTIPVPTEESLRASAAADSATVGRQAETIQGIRDQNARCNLEISEGSKRGDITYEEGHEYKSLESIHLEKQLPLLKADIDAPLLPEKGPQALTFEEAKEETKHLIAVARARAILELMHPLYLPGGKWGVNPIRRGDTSANPRYEPHQLDLSTFDDGKATREIYERLERERGDSPYTPEQREKSSAFVHATAFPPPSYSILEMDPELDAELDKVIITSEENPPFTRFFLPGPGDTVPEFVRYNKEKRSAVIRKISSYGDLQKIQSYKKYFLQKEYPFYRVSEEGKEQRMVGDFSPATLHFHWTMLNLLHNQHLSTLRSQTPVPDKDELTMPPIDYKDTSDAIEKHRNAIQYIVRHTTYKSDLLPLSPSYEMEPNLYKFLRNSLKNVKEVKLASPAVGQPVYIMDVWPDTPIIKVFYDMGDKDEKVSPSFLNVESIMGWE